MTVINWASTTRWRVVVVVGGGGKRGRMSPTADSQSERFESIEINRNGRYFNPALPLRSAGSSIAGSFFFFFYYLIINICGRDPHTPTPTPLPPIPPALSSRFNGGPTESAVGNPLNRHYSAIDAAWNDMCAHAHIHACYIQISQVNVPQFQVT